MKKGKLNGWSQEQADDQAAAKAQGVGPKHAAILQKPVPEGTKEVVPQSGEYDVLEAGSLITPDVFKPSIPSIVEYLKHTYEIMDEGHAYLYTVYKNGSYYHNSPDGWVNYYNAPSPWDIAGTLTELLPGLGEVVSCPVCEEGRVGTYLRYTIVHLNDHHQWSRADIADWLDTLDVDLAFPTPEGATA